MPVNGSGIDFSGLSDLFTQLFGGSNTPTPSQVNNSFENAGSNIVSNFASGVLSSLSGNSANNAGLPSLFTNNNSANDVNTNVIDEPNSQDPAGNYYNDSESWQKYLDLVDSSNAYNSAEAQKARDWSEYMRDTQVQSYMKQLKEAGINPILAVNSGFSGGTYGSTAQAQSYTGTAPYSNSSRIVTSVISAVSNILSSVVGSAGKILSLAK